MNKETSVNAYGSGMTMKYDDYSLLNKGNRELHRYYLKQLLSYLPKTPACFLELGCGTGYFTEVFYEVFPFIAGTAIDGSHSMLQIASDKFKQTDCKIKFIKALIQEIEWQDLASNPIIFSSLAIHHLEDEEKWALFKQIYDNLPPGGVFLTFDVFRSYDKSTNDLMEFLACNDIQTRIKDMLQIDINIDELSIERIKTQDRMIKQTEGDKESILDTYVDHLRKAGFVSVASAFQENRFYGIVAFKP